ncbi:MAG: GNAT family N-acetyltransferase [Alphaproteobacteria bacterium]|jgi:ribosomal-protein-alanine N-acetyltransferase|nr:GNAT family N-acetyltransferase [Alphaproteobacteria bacterium]
MVPYRLSMDELDKVCGLHRACFRTESWSRAQLAASLESSSVEGWGLRLEKESVGFILVQQAGDDVEVLTLAVDPAHRRKGIARGLLSFARNRYPKAPFFLEVAEDNMGARALYESCGYHLIGRRKGYYRRVGGSADALNYRLDTNG